MEQKQKCLETSPQQSNNKNQQLPNLFDYKTMFSLKKEFKKNLKSLLKDGSRIFRYLFRKRKAHLIIMVDVLKFQT